MDDISIDVPLRITLTVRVVWVLIYNIYRNKFSEEEYTTFRGFLISVCGIRLTDENYYSTSYICCDIVEEGKWMIFQLTYL